MEVEESLVARRSKRSTAGNRMQAALAEFKAEEVAQDQEEDKDFAIERDEEDVFGSDFESTDEEAAQEEVDMAIEKEARREDRPKNKGARALARTTAAAHARHKATFNPQLLETPKSTEQTKIKRRVSLGVAVNAETGEVIQQAKRHSQRRHTMLNTSETISRVKDAEEKKSALPKKPKSQIKVFTQDELIARALDMEEDNIQEHRNYLSLEEERRRLARVVRTAVQGPLLRWVTKHEHEQAILKEEAPEIQQSVSGDSIGLSAVMNLASSTADTSATRFTPSQNTFNFPVNLSGAEKMDVCKNYVIHELDQSENPPKPSWHKTMTAMFGAHASWEEMKVYTTKGRPLSRPVQICPITGRVARYKDPRTNVPYSDIAAYKTLTTVLSHEYIWSDVLGCYISQEGGAFAPPPSISRKRSRASAA